MGKVKQKKYKCHSSAPVSMDTDAEHEVDTSKLQSNLINPSLQELGPVQVQNNIFPNIVFHHVVFKPSKAEERMARRSLDIEKSDPLCLKLKEKIMAVKQVIAECKKKKEEDKLKKKKEAVLGEWESLKDALCETEASTASSLSQAKLHFPLTKINAIEKQMV